MPKRTDIKSIMIIGAGPIVIGQACEFDYSGAQACKALREEGYRVILVNSNPATIMTDPDMADATYIEPITPDVVAKIIEKERPDALLPTMGGQTGLNTSLALEEMGVLDKFGVEMIGAKRDAIEMAEDRKLFREAMDRLGLENPKATIANTMEECMDAIEYVGLPAIIRPAFTLGGTGGGVAYNRADYEHFCKSGLDASPVNQILIDESLLGWKEFEMEVVRDKADNAIIVCAIENVDPMGVHTGDSITVAPAKIPRFAFEKFPGSEPYLTTAMKSVGEAMAIGRTIHESLQKALASMETGLTGFDEVDIDGMPAPDALTRKDGILKGTDTSAQEAIDKAVTRELAKQTPDRIRVIAHAMRFGFSDDEINQITAFDPWFLARIREIIEAEEVVRKDGLPMNEDGLRALKMLGFSDARLAKLTGRDETDVRKARQNLGVVACFKRIDTCAAEFEAQTPYMYSTHRLRHLRPLVFRAAHLRARHGNPARRAGKWHAARRHRAVRRPDPVEDRAGLERRGHPDPRHLPRRHRSGRGPRAVPAAGPVAGPETTP